MEFETELVKKLQVSLPADGSIKQLQNAIKSIKEKINFVLLDEPSEETTKLKSELEGLLTIYQNKLSQKLKTFRRKPGKSVSFVVPANSKQNASSGKRDSKKDKQSFGSLLRTRLTVEQHRIRELTEQARCDLQVKGLPKNDVNSICDFVRQSPAEKRIAPIYLIDSIVKNIGSVYIQLFEEHVEGILVSTFKHGQKKARDTVVKILKEWHRRKLFKKEVRKTIYDQLVQLGGNAPERSRTYQVARGSKPLLPHPQQQQRQPTQRAHAQPYSYQPPQPAFNVEAALQRFQFDVQTRPDLRPHLDQIHMKLSMHQDITTDIIHFQQLVNMPPSTDLHQRVQLSQVLTDLEGHISTKSNKTKKRKRVADSRSSVKRKKQKDEGGFWFYDKNDMRKLHTRSLGILYQKKYTQCHVCGMRLAKHQISDHSDMHYLEQVKLRNNKNTRHRAWNVKNWVMDVKNLGKTEGAETSKAPVQKQVLVDEAHPTCQICDNELDKVFDEAHKEWFNLNCVYENGKVVTNRSKPIVHWLCYTKQQDLLNAKSAATEAPPKLESDGPLPTNHVPQEDIEAMMEEEFSSSEAESSDSSDSATEIILFSDDEDEQASSQRIEPAKPVELDNDEPMETEVELKKELMKLEKKETKVTVKIERMEVENPKAVNMVDKKEAPVKIEKIVEQMTVDPDGETNVDANLTVETGDDAKTK